jgi:hypothetical protein
VQAEGGERNRGTHEHKKRDEDKSSLYLHLALNP